MGSIKYLDKYHKLPVPAKAAMWFMVCSILQKGIGLITTPLFTRILSPEDFGLYTVYQSWFGIFVMIISLRLEYSVFYNGMSKFKAERNGYVASMQIITTITACLSFIIYLIFQEQINHLTELSTTIMIFIILKAAVFPSYDFWMIKERYEYRYMSFIIVVLGLSIFNSIAGFVAIYLFPTNGGFARITADFVIYFLIGFFLYILNFKKGIKSASVRHSKYALLFNLPLIPHYIATYILNQLDRIMIQKMVGVVQAGIYSVAFSVGMVMNIVSTSLINSLTPWYYEKLETNNFYAVKRMFIPLICVTSCAIFIFLLFAPEAMGLLAPESYRESIYIIPPIAASIIFSVMYGFFTIPEFYYEANKFSMFASGIAALFNIISNYIFIKTFGYLAAGFTTLACHMIIALAHYFYARVVMSRHNQDFFDVKHITAICLVVVLTIPILCMLYNYTIIRYSIAFITIMGVFIYRNAIISLIKQIKK